AIQALKAEGKSSELGRAIRKVLSDFRGSSLGGIIMLTDGVTTEGEDLPQAAQYAPQTGVPLFFIALGAQHQAPDLIPHHLQAEESCYANDRLVFEARLTAQGYTNLGVQKINLLEKTADGKFKHITSEKVIPDPQGKPVRFRLTHRPTEP